MENHTNCFLGQSPKSEDSQDILDRYLDAFLELSLDIREQCLLKGNVLLNKLAPEYARATMDLDMSVATLELYNSFIKPRLVIWAQRMLDSNLAVSYRVKDASLTTSGGVSLYKSDGSVAFSIDISLYKASSYGAVKYSFSGEEVWGSSIEKIMCDKLLATLSPRRFRRIKDFYDLYVLKMIGQPCDFVKVVQLTLEKQPIEELQKLMDNYPFSPEVLEQLVQAWSKFTLTSFDRTINLQKPEFMQLIFEVGGFYERFEEALALSE